MNGDRYVIERHVLYLRASRSAAPVLAIPLRSYRWGLTAGDQAVAVEGRARSRSVIDAAVDAFEAGITES